MKIGEIVSVLPLEIIAGAGQHTREITGGYASDLLSNVMGHAGVGTVWVTMQAHQNIVAVASLLDLAAVVVAGGAVPDRNTVSKAEHANVMLLTTPLSMFEIVGRLYSLGIKGLS